MHTVDVSFIDAAAADASRLAESLADHINVGFDEVQAKVAANSPDSMDLGATVVLVLGTPALIILSRGIADWIRRMGDPELVIKSGNRSVIVRGGLDLEAKRAIILAALSKDAG